MLWRLFFIPFIITLLSSTSWAQDSCFPQSVTIDDSKLLDEVTSLSITEYLVKAEYSEGCSELPSQRSFKVIMSTMKPGSIKTSIEKRKWGELQTKDSPSWNIRINTSYFDHSATPTLFLKNGDQIIQKKTTNKGGVFYCQNGGCQITPSSAYKLNSKHDIAIQSTPRLINGGSYTNGVHSANVLDERIGLAINKSNDTLIFYSEYASFNELRRFLLTEMNIKEALALDGGNSSSFHSLSIDENQKTHEINITHGFLWINVPYFINFSN